MVCSSVDTLVSSRAADLASARKLRTDDAVNFSSDLDSNDRSLQRNESPAIIDFVTAFRNALLRALFGAVCAIDVDFVRAFRSFSKEPDLIGLNLHESPGDGEKEPTITFTI